MIDVCDQFKGLPPPSLEWKCFLFLTLKQQKNEQRKFNYNF